MLCLSRCPTLCATRAGYEGDLVTLELLGGSPDRHAHITLLLLLWHSKTTQRQLDQREDMKQARIRQKGQKQSARTHELGLALGVLSTELHVAMSLLQQRALGTRGHFAVGVACCNNTIEDLLMPRAHPPTSQCIHRKRAYVPS